MKEENEIMICLQTSNEVCCKTCPHKLPHIRKRECSLNCSNNSCTLYNPQFEIGDIVKAWRKTEGYRSFNRFKIDDRFPKQIGQINSITNNIIKISGILPQGILMHFNKTDLILIERPKIKVQPIENDYMFITKENQTPCNIKQIIDKFQYLPIWEKFHIEHKFIEKIKEVEEVYQTLDEIQIKYLDGWWIIIGDTCDRNSTEYISLVCKDTGSKWYGVMYTNKIMKVENGFSIKKEDLMKFYKTKIVNHRVYKGVRSE